MFRMPAVTRSTLLFVLLLAPLAVWADQNDPRLEDLFAVLKSENDEVQANGIAGQIWAIWVQHEDSRANSLMLRGINQMNANDLYSALDTFDQLIAYKSDFAEAWNKRATIYWQLGNFDASLKDIDEVLKLEPYHFGALSGRGLVYMDRGDYFLARSAFQTLLEVYPAMPGVRNTIQQLDSVLKQGAI